MASIPDFVDVGRAWMVMAQGRSRAPDEQSLAVELRRVFELGREYERARVNEELQALVERARKA